MMVPAGPPLAPQELHGIFLERLLQRPAEAARPVLVDGLEDHEHGAEFEDGGADEARQAGAPEDFAVELGGWRDLREPGEGAVYAPDDGACSWVSAPPGSRGRNSLVNETGGSTARGKHGKRGRGLTGVGKGRA